MLCVLIFRMCNPVTCMRLICVLPWLKLRVALFVIDYSVTVATPEPLLRSHPAEPVNKTEDKQESPFAVRVIWIILGC
jgi:hypothetical protein